MKGGHAPEVRGPAVMARGWAARENPALRKPVALSRASLTIGEAVERTVDGFTQAEDRSGGKPPGPFVFDRQPSREGGVYCPAVRDGARRAPPTPRSSRPSWSSHVHGARHRQRHTLELSRRR